MNFAQWLKANGYVAEAKLSDKQRKHLMAAWKADTGKTAAPIAQPVKAGGTFSETMSAIENESQRRQWIQQATEQACRHHIDNPEKVSQLRTLCEQACSDEKMTARDFEISLMRLDRMLPALATSASSGDKVDNDTLAAAICMSHKLPNLEKAFSARTLEVASRSHRRGLGCQELFHIAAQRNNGYRGSSRDIDAIMREAFVAPAGGMRADIGQSTISVSGILSNVANKFLEQMFLFSEQSWRGFCKIKTANDFKTMTSYRMTGNNKFEKVPPSGELKHGTLGELSYTNRVEQYGKLLGISRPDMINDDLGAFTGAASDMARGAGDSLNEVIYTEWLSDSTFFPTDKSLNNYDDGATDSVLSLAGLENADYIFGIQTKPDGTPLGARPAILLVPRGLRATASNLMNGTTIVGQGQSAAPVPNANAFAGMFRIVDSVYLTYTSLGGSATAWYLLADPNDIAAIEVAFLFGRETPVVETSDMEFNRLGMAMRAYFDFGCNKQEYRAGVKLKGAA